MEEYKKLLKQEVAAFREAGHQFLQGKLTKNEFKAKSGGMGVYAQQDQKTFMIRLRTPSGIITKPHMELILGYAKKYQLSKVHITTRQAVQLHELSIDEVCDIMLDAIDHDLFTRGGGGNFPRNVSLSPLAGVEQGELFDVTPYAVQTGQYFLRNATSYKLPRKLKAAFSGTEEDTACASVNDIGFVAVEEQGEPMFRMWLAGGLGGGARAAVLYPKLVKPEEILYYVEAMIQTFMAEGDYENKGRARTRFIPVRMGEQAFLTCFDSHLAHVRETHQFTGITPELSKRTHEDSLRTPTLIAQRQVGRYTVVLHPLCGQLLTEELEYLTNVVQETADSEVRISMEEELYIRNLTRAEAEGLLTWAKGKMMLTPVRMSLSCVGTPACQIGILQSQKLCKAILDEVEAAGLSDVGLPRIQISGCPNSCARHQTALLGFAGRKIKVQDVMEDGFQLFAGGRISGEGATLGEQKGCILSKNIPAFIVAVGNLLKKEQISMETCLETTAFHDLVSHYIVK